MTRNHKKYHKPFLMTKQQIKKLIFFRILLNCIINMKFKNIVTFCFILNCLLLQYFTKNQDSGKPSTLEDTINTSYKSSSSWFNLQFNSSYQEISENIVNENNYCRKVKNYQSIQDISLNKQKLPTEDHRYIFSDYPDHSLVHQTFSVIARPILHQKSSKTTLDPKINLFFQVNPLWHELHKMETHFLCEGQRYNHIPGSINLNFKDEIANSFRKYKEYYKGREKCFEPWKATPYTLDLSAKEQCLEFVESIKNGKRNEWMYKKARYSHNGDSVAIVSDAVANELINYYEKESPCPDNEKFIAQKYISNPLLLNGRKFDFRVFMFIISMDPLMILYRDGTLRITLEKYRKDSTNFENYLTNSHIADLYLSSVNLTENEYEEKMKDRNINFSKFEEIMKNERKVPDNWINDSFRYSIKRTMLHMVRMNLDKLLSHPRVFEFFGLDFMLDDDLNAWFIELNLSPQIGTTSKEKNKIYMKIIQDILDIEYAILYKADLDEVINKTAFQWVYDGRKTGLDRYHGLLTEECL
ncbi:unnamed protein product [Blepharisma stoltei]|uniref:Uncharacterized protein n=1 Tax=Blepharisma stoltei TaxID=1481888 RepID=A0AAU9JCW5_9CILI|nr:unnamed protein product [Blepharisma stoltei]